MISRDGRYWSTGITVHREPARDRHPAAWYGELDYLDDGWVGDDDPDAGQISTEGTLHTRYAIPDGHTVTGLSAAIDALIADAQKLGIAFELHSGPASLAYRGDGEDPQYPPPDGWRGLLCAETERIGWRGPGGAS